MPPKKKSEPKPADKKLPEMVGIMKAQRDAIVKFLSAIPLPVVSPEAENMRNTVAILHQAVPMPIEAKKPDEPTS